MSPDTHAEHTVPHDPDAMLRELYRAVLVGDAKVGGGPSMKAAIEQLMADVAALKAERSKTSDRMWAAALGAVAGGLGAWVKSLFPTQ